MLALWSHNDALLVMTTRWVKTGVWCTGMAAGLCLVAVVLSQTGAGRGARHRAGDRHHTAQLRQSTMRRGRARSCGLQRSRSRQARRQRTRVRRLPRAIRSVPAFSRDRQRSVIIGPQECESATPPQDSSEIIHPNCLAADESALRSTDAVLRPSAASHEPEVHTAPCEAVAHRSTFPDPSASRLSAFGPRWIRP